MLLCVCWLHVSVCICVCWGRGQVKEVEPGWSAVHDNRWKVWTRSLGLEAAPSLLIVRETHDAAKWLQQRISQASSTSFSPADFLLITSAQDHGALGQTIYGPLISQVPVKSALLAVLVWFHKFPFCVAIMPEPESDRGSQKEAVCVLISSTDEWGWIP